MSKSCLNKQKVILKVGVKANSGKLLLETVQYGLKSFEIGSALHLESLFTRVLGSFQNIQTVFPR